MATVHSVLEALEEIAPRRFAFDFDKVGLQVGDPGAVVTKAVVSLDRSLAAVDFAASLGAELLVSHHPLIFRPIDSVSSQTDVGRTILKLAEKKIAFIAAHTNWDSAQGGVNDTLCKLFGVTNVRPFGHAAEVEQLKLVFFCPQDNVDAVMDACSEAGAGQIGLYRRCAFMSPGTGTFMGEEGSNPTVGQAGRIERVAEVRVEMLLPSTRQRAVSRALLRSHPYEEPAFDFLQLAPLREQAAGRIGDLPRKMSLADFSNAIEGVLETKCLTWGDPSREVQSVAFVGGSADDEWRSAQKEDADVLVTGEVKQHNALEAAESGFALIAAGHYATEQPGADALCERLKKKVSEVQWTIFVPQNGFAGRPC